MIWGGPLQKGLAKLKISEVLPGKEWGGGWAGGGSLRGAAIGAWGSRSNLEVLGAE